MYGASQPSAKIPGKVRNVTCTEFIEVNVRSMDVVHVSRLTFPVCKISVDSVNFAVYRVIRLRCQGADAMILPSFFAQLSGTVTHEERI